MHRYLENAQENSLSFLLFLYFIIFLVVICFSQLIVIVSMYSYVKQ